MGELKERGIVLHVTPGWQFPERHQKLIKERSLRVIYFPVDDVLTRLGAKAILSNVLLTAFLWSMFDQDVDALKSLVGEKFAQKKALLELNMRCIDEGYSFVDPEEGKISVALPSPNKEFSSHLLVTGSQAMGLGAIHAGVRLYAGYPMTPSSPLLSFIADLENKTHMGGEAGGRRNHRRADCERGDVHGDPRAHRHIRRGIRSHERDSVSQCHD
jgi:2-oxoglutarate ferredoxin oxidoreductase subunit alpha